ncbi:unnamed protein product [Ixodes pacificus]
MGLAPSVDGGLLRCPGVLADLLLREQLPLGALWSGRHHHGPVRLQGLDGEQPLHQVSHRKGRQEATHCRRPGGRHRESQPAAGPEQVGPSGYSWLRQFQQSRSLLQATGTAKYLVAAQAVHGQLPKVPVNAVPTGTAWAPSSGALHGVDPRKRKETAPPT